MGSIAVASLLFSASLSLSQSSLAATEHDSSAPEVANSSQTKTAGPLMLNVSCSELDVSKEHLSTLLQAELDANEFASLQVELSCDTSPHLVIIEVTQLLDSSSLSLDVTDLSPDDQARAISLSIAETISFLSSEPDLQAPEENNDETAPSPPRTSDPNKPTETAKAKRNAEKAQLSNTAPSPDPLLDAGPPIIELSLALGPLFRGYWGGRAQIGAILEFNRAQWNFGAKVLTGNTNDKKGGNGVNAFVGYDFLYSQAERFRAILGAEVGLGYVGYDSSQGASITTSGFAGCHFKIAREWQARIVVEIGYAGLIISEADKYQLGLFAGASILIGAIL